MPTSEPKPESSRSRDELEEWLQLPDSEESASASGAFQPEDFSPSGPDESGEQGLFALEELQPPEPPADEKSGAPVEKEEEQDDESVDSEEVERLKETLSREFGDTLTGMNAATGPVGVFVLVLALVAWSTPRLLGLLHMDELAGDIGRPVLITAAILSLAGLHLVFYWAVHQASNTVKSRELDRLLEARRVDDPCRHLDCREATNEEEGQSGPGEEADRERLEGELRWRCNLFSLELEGEPLCAVCDRYESEGESLQAAKSRG